MAGLLSDILGGIDRAKQSVSSNFGLLMDNPQEYMRQINESARDINRQDSMAVQGKRAMLSGVQPTPEQAAAMEAMRQRAENLAMGFAGTVIGKPMNLWHGSKDIRWMKGGEEFNQNFTANMPSKYLWASPKKDIANTYAGISEMQLEKYASGLGSKPSEFAGVQPVVLNKGANILNVKDVKKTSKELGISWSGKNPLEKLLDAAKSKGYDAVKMEMDAGNIAILNPKMVKY